jgi:cobyrinic acid a,c-diamide synthase
MGVKFELPFETLEPLFNALSLIKPNQCTRLESKALGLLKSSLYFELEKLLETTEEMEEREINFKTLFQEERERRKKEYIERVGEKTEI